MGNNLNSVKKIIKHKAPIIILILVIGVSACGKPTAPTITNDQLLQTAMAQISLTQTSFPTETLPPTSTSIPPTDTPSPTFTPVVITSDDVIATFKSNGLEADNPQPMTKEDYGLAPYVCQGTRFFIPSLGANKGGRIFVCPNSDDQTLLATYYQELGRQSAAFFSWVFIKKNVLVQINGDLAEDVARKYEAAIPNP